MTFDASMHTCTIIAYQDDHFSSYFKNNNLNYHFKKVMMLHTQTHIHTHVDEYAHTQIPATIFENNSG
ncbi:hypothetical protein BDC45DRAFT_516176 [Circinella umbellata]|nr:hypothetical protein BDC45DRAFT_516161 [Circinella umbellata]KAI7851279.1 hypothetical protein BDC45DRAFT_516176 [Circinella umbellata]